MSERIGRFEDLIAWQKARRLTAEVYRATAQGGFARDFGLKDQVRRAAVSVMANIAEGFERGRAREFHHFLCLAKASCAELRSHLYVALDAQYLSQEQFDRMGAAAEEVGRVVGGLRCSVERRLEQA